MILNLPSTLAASVLCAAVCAVPSAHGSLLGSAQNFAVLAGTTVTNTGATSISGNVGVWPNNAVTGFPPGDVSNGIFCLGDATAQAAWLDASSAYVTLAALAPTQDLTGQDLGGLLLTAGVYTFTSSAQLTGTITLDGLGDPTAVFVFQIASTLTTASASLVQMINGASSANIYWQVGSSATLGTGTAFAGNILAQTSITMTTGASINGGCALALDGAVTLDTNIISTPVPAPAASLVLTLACAPCIGGRRRKA